MHRGPDDRDGDPAPFLINKSIAIKREIRNLDRRDLNFWELHQKNLTTDSHRSTDSIFDKSNFITGNQFRSVLICGKALDFRLPISSSLHPQTPTPPAAGFGLCGKPGQARATDQGLRYSAAGLHPG